MTPIIVHPFEKMTDDDARNARTAHRELAEHWGHSNRVDERLECTACTLQGYLPSGKAFADLRARTRQHGPNYSGWARVYVQAKATIPHKWLNAFKHELDRIDNPRYATALKRDISVFGLRIA